MTLLRALLIGALLTTGGWGQPSIAQKRKVAPLIVAPDISCPPATDLYRDWLSKGSWPIRELGSNVPGDAIHEVRQDRLPEAIALADTAEIVSLTDRQADEFVGKTPEAAWRSGRPYLVRNVVPGPIAKYEFVSVRLVGTRLRIGAGVIGCGGFRKSPVVIFLPTAPTGVDIMASAIL